MYSQGYGVTKNQLESLRLFRLAAEQGDMQAQGFLGLYYANGGEGFKADPKESLKWYRLAAAQGNPNAQYALGLMYEYGNNVAEDINIAINWFQLAATNGNILASNHLKLLKKPTHSNPKPIVEKIKLTPAVPQNDPLNIRN